MSVKHDLILALVWVSLMTKDTECLSMCLLAVCISPLDKRPLGFIDHLFFTVEKLFNDGDLESITVMS